MYKVCTRPTTLRYRKLPYALDTIVVIRCEWVFISIDGSAVESINVHVETVERQQGVRIW